MRNILSAENKQIFILIALAYAFSVICRMDWVWWASGFNECIWDGKLIINTNDGYAFAEGARDMLAGFHQKGDLSYYGSPLSTLTYLIVKFSPFSLESVMLYLSVVLSSFVVIPLVLIGREIGSLRVGFGAALLASVAHSYYNRTMAGYYDTDMLNITLACFVVWGLVRLNARCNVTSMMIAPVSMLIYFWWYSSSFTLNIAVIAVFAGYTLLWARKEKMHYLALILMLLAITSVYFWLKVLLFALIFLAYKKGFYYRYVNKQKSIIIALGVAVFALFVIGGGLNPIWFQLKFYILRSTPENDALNFIFFNVNQTIMESSVVPFSIFAERIASSVSVFVLCLIGYILACVKHRILLVSLPMSALGFLALFSGLRFTIYSVPFMAFGFVFLLFFIGTKLNEGIKDKKLFWYVLACAAYLPILYFIYIQASLEQMIAEFWLVLAVFVLAHLWVFYHFAKDLAALLVFVGCALALAPSLLHIYAYKASSVFYKNEIAVLDKLKGVANPEDYALSWWDYGYGLRFYSDVKTLIDGGKHLGADNYAVSFALSKPQTEAANMARLEVEYTERKLDEKFGLNLAQMMKDYNASDVNEFLLSLENPGFKLPKKTRDIYFVLPDRMHAIMPVITRFSFLDLKTGRSYTNNIFIVSEELSKSERGIELGDGLYINSGLDKVGLERGEFAINTFINTKYENGKLRVERAKIDPRAELFVIYMNDYGRVLIMDKAMFESTYVQLFILENYEEDIYEPVVLDPAMKIYKLKF